MSELNSVASLLRDAEQELSALRPRSDSPHVGLPAIPRQVQRKAVALSTGWPHLGQLSRKNGSVEAIVDEYAKGYPTNQTAASSITSSSEPVNLAFRFVERTPVDMQFTGEKIDELVKFLAGGNTATSKSGLSPDDAFVILDYLGDSSDAIEREIRARRPRDSMPEWTSRWYSAWRAAYKSVRAWELATEESEVRYARKLVKESFGWLDQYWPFTPRKDDRSPSPKTNVRQLERFQGVKTLVDRLRAM